MTRSAGLLDWPRKNQCHQPAANLASARASASPIGTASRTTRRSTRQGGRGPVVEPRRRPGRARQRRTVHARAQPSGDGNRQPWPAWSKGCDPPSSAASTTDRSHGGPDTPPCGWTPTMAQPCATWRGSWGGRAATARWAGTAVPDPQGDVINRDVGLGKSVEHSRNGTHPFRPSHGDDDLRAGVLRFDVPDRRSCLAEGIGAVDDRRDPARLGKFS